MRICCHTVILACANIKHVVIKRVNNRWYICLMLELPDRAKTIFYLYYN